jgi:hypothetical protein
MRKIEELEKKWFNYKLKKIVSPFLSLGVVTMIMGTGYYFYDMNPKKLTNVLGVSIEVNSTNVSTKVKMIENPIVVKPMVKPMNIEKPIVKLIETPIVELLPIIPVIDMEKEERISAVRSTSVKKYNAVKTEKLVRAKKNSYLTSKELVSISKVETKVSSAPRKTKKMNFKSTSVNYIETIKAKFAKSNNSREALLLAKFYYENKNYKASEKWSLSANKLNNDLEESWLLFAKSKVKLGKKREALTVLVSYYKKSHSIKAKRLIGQIKAGRI